MPDPQTQPAKKPGVSPLWRTAMVCVLVGMCLHWWMARARPEPGDLELTIRGDPLPDDYDPRLDQVLDAVDFENIPLHKALLAIARRVGINLVLTPDVNPGGSEPITMLRALHLKYVKAGDALDAVLSSAGLAADVRANWVETGGILYSSADRYQSPRLFTRFYDVKRLLDRHEAFQAAHPSTNASPATQPDGAIFRSGPAPQVYTDGRADWLEEILDQQTTDFSTLFAGGHGISRSYYPDVLIVTATAEQHRIIAKILRKLDEK